MNIVYLLLGSNEGDRRLWLQHALELIAVNCGTIVRTSGIYSTAAWGLQDQPDFYNMAIELHSNLTSADLLLCIQEIEQQLGRQRTVKWGRRTLDIDILFYNDEIINHESLTIPHPFLPQRRFALAPLAEIAAGLKHPALNKTVAELLEECPDPLSAEIVT